MPSLLSYLKRAGFRGPALRTMYGIVMAESGGNPRALNDTAPDLSYGLAQINMFGDMGPARRAQFGLSSNDDLYDPVTNLKAAYRISSGGKDFTPWTTYTSGAYKAHQFPRGPAGRAPITADPAAGGAPPIRDASYYVAMALGRSPKRTGESANQQPVSPTPRDASFYVQMALGKKPHKQMAGVTADGLRLPVRWKGTHNTDNLTSAGRNTAIDLMAAAGTPVIAPFAGVVERWGSAQGGQAMYLRAKNGKRYWLGHVDNMIPVGTRFSSGQTIARISGDHPSPHAHWDWL